VARLSFLRTSSAGQNGNARRLRRRLNDLIVIVGFFAMLAAEAQIDASLKGSGWRRRSQLKLMERRSRAVRLSFFKDKGRSPVWVPSPFQADLQLMAKGKIAHAVCAVEQGKVTNSLHQVAGTASTRKINKDANGGKHSLKPDQLGWARGLGKWADVDESWQDAAEVRGQQEAGPLSVASSGQPVRQEAGSGSVASPDADAVVSPGSSPEAMEAAEQHAKLSGNGSPLDPHAKEFVCLSPTTAFEGANVSIGAQLDAVLLQLCWQASCKAEESEEEAGRKRQLDQVFDRLGECERVVAGMKTEICQLLVPMIIDQIMAGMPALIQESLSDILEPLNKNHLSAMCPLIEESVSKAFEPLNKKVEQTLDRLKALEVEATS